MTAESKQPGAEPVEMDWQEWHAQTVAERHALFLQRTGFLFSPEAIAAFEAVDRADFLMGPQKPYSMNDRPHPISEDREPANPMRAAARPVEEALRPELVVATNSQPTLVAMMVEALRVRPGDKVLDIGSGSGWTATVLAHMASREGAVFGTELKSELARWARDNFAQYGLENVQLKHTGKLDCWADEGPFDAIMVAAAAKELPKALTEQLAEGGRMAIPIGEELAFVSRRNGEVRIEGTLPEVRFVPLVTV